MENRLPRIVSPHPGDRASCPDSGWRCRSPTTTGFQGIGDRSGNGGCHRVGEGVPILVGQGDDIEMAADENGRAWVLIIEGSPQVARAQVAGVVQRTGEAAGRSNRIHVVQHEGGIGQGKGHGGVSMQFSGARNLLSMVEAGPVGGTVSSATEPGLKGFRPSSGRCHEACTGNGGRCLSCFVKC